jgi:hypothetical protein
MSARGTTAAVCRLPNRPRSTSLQRPLTKQIHVTPMPERIAVHSRSVKSANND